MIFFFFLVLFCAVFSPKDRETRKPRGFTFCQYRRKEDADEAVKGMHKRVGSLARNLSHVPLWLADVLCLLSDSCVWTHAPDLCSDLNLFRPLSLGSRVFCVTDLSQYYLFPRPGGTAVRGSYGIFPWRGETLTFVRLRPLSMCS